MNMRTLRHMRDQEDRESEQWKEHFEDILLNIEDDLVRVDLDDKWFYYLCINYTQISLIYAGSYACKITNWALLYNIIITFLRTLVTTHAGKGLPFPCQPLPRS